jgi:crossover junction endodeoxyribonuclease RusA
MPDEETLYPFEVVLQGTPIALQCKTGGTREAWKERVKEAARQRQRATYELGFLDNRALAVTIYYFPSAPMEGDVDNIVKLIMDGMIGDRLALALDTEPPAVYIRVEDDLSWRTIS